MEFFMKRLFVGVIALCFTFPAVAAESGKGLNPDIGVNLLGLYLNGTNISADRRQSRHKGFSLQEAELQFTSDVDPYLRAFALFSVKSEDGEWGIDPEEVYAETINLPHVTVRGGKFKMALGRHNQLHTHAFPFIDAPLIHQELLGDEGLNEVGVSAAVLMPLPWFSELTLQGFTLSNETLYGSEVSADIGALARFRNLWDLSDSLTLEFGASGTSGHNGFGAKSSVWGGDLTWKWRPTAGGRYRSLQWSTEYLNGNRAGKQNSLSESEAKLSGGASWLQYQFAERWWVQGRYEISGLSHADALVKKKKESLLVGFFPSEFSGLRLQYDWIQDPTRTGKDYAVSFQYNISIGAHPAHAY